MKSKGHDGQYRLVHGVSRRDVEKGETFMLSCKQVRIIGGQAPHRPGTVGKVFVEPIEGGTDMAYYASVFGVEWVPEFQPEPKPIINHEAIIAKMLADLNAAIEAARNDDVVIEINDLQRSTIGHDSCHYFIIQRVLRAP